MIDAELVAQATILLQQCRERRLMLATAESCTGGLIAGCLTEVAGSSDVVDRGFVTYSNSAKIDVLGVSPALLAEHGAISEPVARAMAEGALARAPVQLAVGVTGITGPGGATATKPLGLVYLACARAGRPTLARECRFGDIGRERVRREAVAMALDLLKQQLEDAPVTPPG